MDGPQVIAFFRDGGVIAVLIFFIAGFLRGWWLFGGHLKDLKGEFEARYEEMRDDRDYWRGLAQELLGTARDSVRLAERQHRGEI